MHVRYIYLLFIFVFSSCIFGEDRFHTITIHNESETSFYLFIGSCMADSLPKVIVPLDFYSPERDILEKNG